MLSTVLLFIVSDSFACVPMRAFRFLYINIYAFLVSALGILVALIPLYKITWILFIFQCLIAIKLFMISAQIFSTWDSKKREIELLKNRNSSQFRPDTFKIYMQAPCSRLVVRAALSDLNLRSNYKELGVYKKSIFVLIKENFQPVEQSIYINEDYL
jgi:hypothetical protein